MSDELALERRYDDMAEENDKLRAENARLRGALFEAVGWVSNHVTRARLRDALAGGA